jgi:hypothetical protein
VRKSSKERSAKWRAANPERVKELTKKYYDRDRVKIRERQNKWRKEHPGWFKTLTQVSYRNTLEGWAKYKVNSLRTVSKKRQLAFDLTWEDIAKCVVDKCPVSGIKLNYNVMNGKSKMANDSPSVDRIDNTKGYIKGNIIIVSNLVNRVKTSLTLDELQSLLPKMVKFYRKFMK